MRLKVLLIIPALLMSATIQLHAQSPIVSGQACSGDLGGTFPACTVPADTITPDMILSTGQVDEYVLTYEATGDTFEWQASSSGAHAVDHQDGGSDEVAVTGGMMNADFGDFTCVGTATGCDIDANTVGESELLESMNFTATGTWDFSTSGVATVNSDDVLFSDPDSKYSSGNIEGAFTELDDDNGAMAPNQLDYKVNWNQIGNMPTDFADGTDASGAGSGAFSDASDPVVLNSTGKTVEIGPASGAPSGKVAIHGDADEVQLIIEGNATQTANLVTVQDSSQVAVLTLDNSGNLADLASVATNASNTPSIVFNDAQTGSETNDAVIFIDETDAGGGTEDVDLTIQVQVNSDLTDRIFIDADGATDIKNSILTIDGNKVLDVDDTVYEEAYIGAEGMDGDGTNCDADPTETLVNGWPDFIIGCDNNDSSVLTWTIGAPKSYTGGAIYVGLHLWSSGSQTGVVRFDVAILCTRDGDQVAAQAATGEQAVQSTFQSQTNDFQFNESSSAITPNGTCTDAREWRFRAAVDQANTSATNNTWEVLGASIRYPAKPQTS